MKPNDWNDLSDSHKTKIANDLINSPRGYLILGHALAVAVLRLKTAQHPQKSHIEDMEILGEGLYPPIFAMYLKEEEDE